MVGVGWPTKWVRRGDGVAEIVWGVHSCFQFLLLFFALNR